jgi:hypothetical protein
LKNTFIAINELWIVIQDSFVEHYALLNTMLQARQTIIFLCLFAASMGEVNKERITTPLTGHCQMTEY